MPIKIFEIHCFLDIFMNIECHLVNILNCNKIYLSVPFGTFDVDQSVVDFKISINKGRETRLI